MATNTQDAASKAAPRKRKAFPKMESNVGGKDKSIACSTKSHMIVEMLAEAANIPRSRMLDKIIEEYATMKLSKVSFK